MRKFLVLSKNRERSTSERLSLLSEYVTSRFQSSACLRRYLHQHFRTTRIDDEEVAALAGLLAMGLRADPAARRPLAAMRAHKYWDASDRSSACSEPCARRLCPSFLNNAPRVSGVYEHNT